MLVVACSSELEAVNISSTSFPRRAQIITLDRCFRLCYRPLNATQWHYIDTRWIFKTEQGRIRWIEDQVLYDLGKLLQRCASRGLDSRGETRTIDLSLKKDRIPTVSECPALSLCNLGTMLPAIAAGFPIDSSNGKQRWHVSYSCFENDKSITYPQAEKHLRDPLRFHTSS